MRKRDGYESVCPKCNQIRILKSKPRKPNSPCLNCVMVERNTTVLAIRRVEWNGERDELGKPIVRCTRCDKPRSMSNYQAAEKYSGTMCAPCQWESNRENRICRECGTTESDKWFGFKCHACTNRSIISWKKDRIAKRIACSECRNPPAPGHVKCEKHLEITRQRQKAKRDSDPECVKRRKLAWNAANPDKLRAMRKAKYEANKFSYFESARRRRARKRNAPGAGLSKVDWENIVSAQDAKCIDCGEKPEKLTVGHLVPLFHGGAHDKSNIVGQCLPCNLRQGTKIHPLALSLIRVA